MCLEARIFDTGRGKLTATVVTDEPVEVRDFKTIMDQFGGKHRRPSPQMNESETGRCQHVTGRN